METISQVPLQFLILYVEAVPMVRITVMISPKISDLYALSPLFINIISMVADVLPFFMNSEIHSKRFISVAKFVLSL